LTVDVQSMDWATMLKRRNSKEPTANGGWNLLHSYTGGLTVSTPVWSIAFSGACEKGLFGWPCDQALEDLRLKWALVEGVESKKQVAAEYSRQAFAMGHHVPLGQWTTYVAHRANLSGVLDSQDITVFWNMKKAP
jgi:peptide/nickel transport system substrate-binding protein